MLWSPLVLLLFILSGEVPIDVTRTGADPALVATTTKGYGHIKVWFRQAVVKSSGKEKQ